MIANFTESLNDLLINKGYGTGEQDQSLTDIINLMNKFPTFIIDENTSLSMLELFIDKYDIREIGSETEELFLHYWKEKTNELIVKYKPKMDMWIEHFNELFKFTVQLTTTDKNTSNNQNTYYLNPVSKNIENLKVSDVDKTNMDSSRTIIRDALQTVWGKTRADILNKILEVRDVFNDCLSEYDVIFMGVF